MDIKKIATKATTYNRPKETICIGNCRHRNYRYNGNHYCEIISDYMDGNYICPKYDNNYRYCEKMDIYCFIENHCLNCPFEYDESLHETFTENLDDNKYDNGGYNR